MKLSKDARYSEHRAHEKVLAMPHAFKHLEVGDVYGLALYVVGVLFGDTEFINYIVLDSLLSSVLDLHLIWNGCLLLSLRLPLNTHS